MKKMISLFMIMIVCMNSISAMAADEFIYNPITGKMLVNGVLASGRDGEIVTLQMIKPGKYISADDLKNKLDSDAPNVYQHVDQTVSTAGGTYHFGFNTNAAAGLYTIRITSQGSNDVMVKTISVVTAEDVENAITKINSCVDGLKMEQFFGTADANVLGFDIPEFNALTNKSEVYSFMANTIDQKQFENTDFDGATAAFRSAVALSAIKHGAISAGVDTAIKNLLDTFESQLKVKEASSYTTYNDTYFDDTFRSAVRKQLPNKNYTSVQSLIDAFNEAVILQANINLKEFADAIKMIDDNMGTLTSGANSSAKLDIALYNTASANKKLEAARDIAFNVYGTQDEYVKAINAALAKSGSNTPSGGGGGGGGGNSGGKEVTIEGTNINVPVQQQNQFLDLTGVEWAIKSINTLASRGAISGTGDGYFTPNENVTREQFVKMIVLALGLPLSGVADFVDVDTAEWYYPYIGAANQSGLVNGISENEFGIGEKITREQMAALVYRFGKNIGINFDESDEAAFADDDKISSYAKTAVTAMKNAGIIRGVGNDNFAPKAFATRAEAAHTIYVMLLTYGKIEVGE